MIILNVSISNSGFMNSHFYCEFPSVRVFTITKLYQSDENLPHLRFSALDVRKTVYSCFYKWASWVILLVFVDVFWLPQWWKLSLKAMSSSSGIKGPILDSFCWGLQLAPALCLNVSFIEEYQSWWLKIQVCFLFFMKWGKWIKLKVSSL